MSINFTSMLRQPLFTVLVSCLLTWPCAHAQQVSSRATITPNYKDADLSQITEAVSAVTGKTIIIDPRVKAQVTMLSSTPMSPNAFYEAYLSILQVHGFVAVPSGGNTLTIIPDANARQVPANDLPGSINSNSSELVTQVITVRNVSAAQLVPILRPLVATYGNLVAYSASNMLVITDRANNVNRMLRIIERIDKATDDNFEIIQMQNATASEIIKVVNSLSASGATPAPADGGQPLKVVADDRTNSIIISGDKAAQLRIRTLITYLDTPLQNGSNTKTRFLEYADAETMANSLKAQIQGITQAATGSAAPGGASSSNLSNSVSIWADKATNALVVSAPPKIMEQIMSIVDTLDIRLANVKLEAIVVEVSASKSAELGVNWALYGNANANVPAAIFNGGSTPITSVASAALTNNLSGLPSGTTLGVGRIIDSGVSFAAILHALQEDGNTNIISTPSITTQDNKEAKIEVTQQVPLITGQYTSTGTSSGTTSGSTGTVNPFTTIQRQDVGTKLHITPKISKGGTITLKITQESSSLSQQTGDAGSLITNKRSIETQVLVDDGQTIILGGLLDDKVTEGASRVPLLGSIPLIGNLFKSSNSKKSKTNLLVFIKPTVMRNAIQASYETNSKYNFVRDLQLNINGGNVSLQPNEQQPLLPELPQSNTELETTPAVPAKDLSTAPLTPAESGK